MPVPVAIAVVSWNTRDLLDACLSSMRPEVERGRAEVWVVDNGSTDGSTDLVREDHPWARVLTLERNLGYGGAVNLVAARTETPWVAPSNADVELLPGALDALLDAGARHARAGVLGPRLILPDGSTQPGVQPFPGIAESLLRHAAAHRLSARIGRRLCVAEHWNPEAPAVVDWVTGAFLLVRRETWRQIGGFDDSQWMYAEDLDLCWRASRAGWQVRYEPSAQVRHHLSVATARAFGDESARRIRMRRADYAWLAARRGRLYAQTLSALEITALRSRSAAFNALSSLTRDPEWRRRAARDGGALRIERAARAHPHP